MEFKSTHRDANARALARGFFVLLAGLSLWSSIGARADDSGCLAPLPPDIQTPAELARASAALAELVGPSGPDARSTARSCSAYLPGLCSQFQTGPKGVVTRYPDGTVELNPLTNLRDWPAADRALLDPANVDQANFTSRIRPMFERLKATLIARVKTMPSGSAFRTFLLQRYARLDIRVENFDRCSREDRLPLVARFDGDDVLICPVVSHMRAMGLATILGHELGHSVDPCGDGVPQGVSTEGFAFESIHLCASRTMPRGSTLRAAGSPANCDRNDEIFADYIGATLANLTFRPEEYPTDPKAAALEYYGFRFQTACDRKGYENFLAPVAQSSLGQRVLGCTGFDEETACPGLVR